LAAAASGSTLSQTKKHNDNPDAKKNTTPSIPSKSRNFPLPGGEETGEGERSLSSPTNNSSAGTVEAPATAASGSTLSQTNRHDESPEAKKNTTPLIANTPSPLPPAIDTTIQWKNPSTWPVWYRKINSRKLLRYVARRRIRFVTPDTLIPGELIGYDGPQALSAEYKRRLQALGIPFRDESAARFQEAA